ncbi:MAG: glycogen/starch synthase [Dysgonamonadaceae bacterium]|jgi:starch synthase|nr:glycogen/starch synthase [Dysgonamonadaceae bacterium]
MVAKKILFITTEISPYVNDTEMSLIARKLPQGIHDRGKEIRTFMPKFGCINERRNQLHEVIRLSGMNLIVNESDHPLVIKVASIQAARMQIYFIDNEDFFHRKALLHDENGEAYEDNDERSIFYVRGVMETIKKLRWIPDLVHCHGWMTALAPLYIKTYYKGDPCFKNVKVIYSLYDDEFKRPLRDDFAKKVQIEGITQNDVEEIRNNPDFVALSKLAMKFSDGIIAGSLNVNPALIEYAQHKKNALFLPFQSGDTYIDAFDTFYDRLLSEQVNELTS